MMDGRRPTVFLTGGEGGGQAGTIMLCFRDAIPGSKGVMT